MASHQVVVIDSSVLCCWLNVPGKSTCGPDNDRWTHKRVSDFINTKIQEGATFVLPIASMIETGNHIAQSPGNCYQIAIALADLMKATANGQSPWAAFELQNELWRSSELIKLADEWPQKATSGIGIGDATIISVADFYAIQGTIQVTIFTGDQGLKAYQPAKPESNTPRRRTQ